MCLDVFIYDIISSVKSGCSRQRPRHSMSPFTLNEPAIRKNRIETKIWKNSLMNLWSVHVSDTMKRTENDRINVRDVMMKRKKERERYDGTQHTFAEKWKTSRHIQWMKHFNFRLSIRLFCVSFKCIHLLKEHLNCICISMIWLLNFWRFPATIQFTIQHKNVRQLN